MFPLPNPLHPAVVHLPLALALLLPLLAGLAAIAVARAWLPVRAWSIVIVLHALLTGSGWMALETGEDQRERVKEFVSRDLVESHHEQGMLFVGVAAGALLVVAAGLLKGRPGGAARAVYVLVAAGVLATAVRTGASGGALVYEHGAANAYLERGAGGPPDRADHQDAR